jgi:hypothetical protein
VKRKIAAEERHSERKVVVYKSSYVGKGALVRRLNRLSVDIRRQNRRDMFAQLKRERRQILVAFIYISLISVIIFQLLSPRTIYQTRFVPEYQFVEVLLMDVVNDDFISEREVALIDQYDYLLDRYDAMSRMLADSQEVNTALMQELAEIRDAQRRTQPRWQFNNNVMRGHRDPSPDLQWLVHDMLYEHGLIELEHVFAAMITYESHWRYGVSSGRGHFGLLQIMNWWLISPPLASFRITDDFRGRNLLNAEHNLLTAIEMLRFAEMRYDFCAIGEPHKWVHYHSTGNSPVNCNGNTRCCYWRRLAVPTMRNIEPFVPESED